jgi:hypothetical protein
VLARWKEHSEEHLNESSESEQPTRPVDLRNNEVDIDLPRREEIEGGLKYLKKQQGGPRGFYLLKNYVNNLVEALHEEIQQAWTSERLPKS